MAESRSLTVLVKLRFPPVSDCAKKLGSIDYRGSLPYFLCNSFSNYFEIFCFRQDTNHFLNLPAPYINNAGIRQDAQYWKKQIAESCPWLQPAWNHYGFFRPFRKLAAACDSNNLCLFLCCIFKSRKRLFCVAGIRRSEERR